PLSNPSRPSSPRPVSPDSSVEAGDPTEAEILRAVRSLRFGSVEVVVHEGSVVQIVRTERLRLGGAGPTGRKV
ncbi:MAG: YezD family protein, partial [Polyangiaceae bacterium]|nr:YezD family protein [Polyangiaceae bacterium]